MSSESEKTATVEPVVSRIRFQLRTMAPHQRERLTAKLLEEAAQEIVRLEERMRVLSRELLSIRVTQVNDRFDEGCQLRSFRELVDRWVPKSE